MKIALTGATGFLGRHVVERLSKNHEVRCISRSGRPVLEAEGIAADVTDANALEQAFAGCEVVIHAAGMVSHEQVDAERLWDVHVVGTERVVEACRAAGVRR